MIFRGGLWNSQKKRRALFEELKDYVGDETLRLDFAGNGYFLDDGHKTATTEAERLLTVERATSKWVLKEHGVYEEVPVDTLAREWNPETGEYAALIEGSATNELLFSTQFDNAAWVKHGATVTPNVGPVLFAGQGGMARLECNTTGGFNGRVAQSRTLDTTGWWTGAFYASVDVTSWLMITLETPGEGGRRAWFNLSTGEVTSTAGAGGASWLYKTGIKSIGNGVYCCWLSVDMQLLTNPASFFVTCPNGDGSSISDVGNSVLVSQAQLEQGTRPTSPIITTDAPKTRAADVPKRVLGSEFNKSAFTSVLEFYGKPHTQSSVSQLMALSSATASNAPTRISYRVDDGGSQQIQIVVGGIAWVSRVITELLTDGENKVAIRIDTLNGAFAIAVNGVIDVFDSGFSGDFSSLEAAWLSSDTGNAYNKQSNWTIYPYAMTDAELQELTQ